MTKVPKARLVLQDVQHVRNKLEDEVCHIEWRLNWVLAVVLLRAVGHVLDKVDGANNPLVKSTANQLYKSWSSGEENEIFRSFIDLERNSILKEYASDITEGPVPLMVRLKRNDGVEVLQQFLIEENIYRPMGAGEYEGEDGRTVLDIAIEWWTHQLDEVDKLTSRI